MDTTVIQQRIRSLIICSPWPLRLLVSQWLRVGAKVLVVQAVSFICLGMLRNHTCERNIVLPVKDGRTRNVFLRRLEAKEMR